jgi:hypothetical protein
MATSEFGRSPSSTSSPIPINSPSVSPMPILSPGHSSGSTASRKFSTTQRYVINHGFVSHATMNTIEAALREFLESP